MIAGILKIWVIEFGGDFENATEIEFIAQTAGVLGKRKKTFSGDFLDKSLTFVVKVKEGMQELESYLETDLDVWVKYASTNIISKLNSTMPCRLTFDEDSGRRYAERDELKVNIDCEII